MALPVPGYASTLNVGGTSTATTGEATSLFSSALGAAFTVRQVTNAAKRAADPSVAVVVKDGGTPIAAANYIYDYLYSKVRFQNYTPVGAITVDQNYIPLLPVLGVTAFTVEMMRDEHDTTTLSNGVVGGESSILGIKKASGDISFNLTEFDDQDPGAGTQTFFNYLNGGGSFLLDLQLGPTGSTGGFRAWCKLPDIERVINFKELISKKFKWHAVNGADDSTKDAWFSATEAFT